jgi:hypothetical protein
MGNCGWHALSHKHLSRLVAGGGEVKSYDSCTERHARGVIRRRRAGGTPFVNWTPAAIRSSFVAGVYAGFLLDARVHQVHRHIFAPLSSLHGYGFFFF